jgi:hypothetical protein
VHEVLRAAAEGIKHVLESLEPRLVSLRLFRGQHRVKRRAQLVDIESDLGVGGIGEDDQRQDLGQLRQRRRDVRVRSPAWHRLDDRLCVGRIEGDTPAPAGPLQRAMQHLWIRLPRAEHLVEAIGGEVFEKGCHPVRPHSARKPVTGDIADPVIDERAVAVERDVADR